MALTVTPFWRVLTTTCLPSQAKPLQDYQIRVYPMRYSRMYSYRLVRLRAFHVLSLTRVALILFMLARKIVSLCHGMVCLHCPSNTSSRQRYWMINRRKVMLCPCFLSHLLRANTFSIPMRHLNASDVPGKLSQSFPLRLKKKEN